MTPEAFVKKWKTRDLSERAAAQSHFLDLCKVLGQPGPTDVDATGEEYAFEKGATKTTGGEGWADVWKRGHFGWEYKGKRKNLDAAFAQLQQYAPALENPPLLVVCDLDKFRVHTNWTSTVSSVHVLSLEDLLDPEKLNILRHIFTNPERLKPGLTRQVLTEQAASEFAELARRLRERQITGGVPHKEAAEKVAHFVNRLIFCMFAEDVNLLPEKMFSRMVQAALVNPGDFVDHASKLFAAMRSGGLVGFERVEWFNGGLFDTDEALSLEKSDVELLLRAAKLDWSEVDPSILGTLFERGLDPDKRSQLGAHYTDRAKIMMIIEPVIERPLLAEWSAARAEIEAKMAAAATTSSKSVRTQRTNEAESIYRRFLERLRTFKVLDPACGSGNFLYLALQALKDIERRVAIEAETLGFPREFPAVGPEQLLGIEINPYAAELARVSVWIGEIQWMRKNGFDVSRDPILKSLGTIENRDALIDTYGTETTWPRADAIIGNPPFLGAKRMVGLMGRDHVSRLRAAFHQLPAFVDLVTYWFEKSRAALESGRAERVGLVGTNSISMGSNLPVLERIAESCRIFSAWDDEEWTVDGANVRVAIVCFDKSTTAKAAELNGASVSRINPDLTHSRVTLTSASPIPENNNVAFVGIQKSGPFDVPYAIARGWLLCPLNPNGKPNSDVLRPHLNGLDVARRSRDVWIVDFDGMSEDEAALYEAPFEYVRRVVKPVRDNNSLEAARTYWWRLWRARPELKGRIARLKRVIVTPEVSRHRIFVWQPATASFDKNLTVITRDDDVTFGILHSKFHEKWSLALGSWLGIGNDPRYTPTTTFMTYPFPEGLTPDLPTGSYASDPRAIRVMEAARRLAELRDNWLNPADLIKRIPEVVPGYPDRILPKDDVAAKLLRTRTLTNLYNERPTWLTNAHAALDATVAAAYGWPEDIGEEEALERLLEMNHQRSSTRPQGQQPQL